MGQPESGQQVAYYVARDAGQAPLAFAAVALFGPFAVLVNLLSHPGRPPGASWARYQLHTCLALDLGRAGVRHLRVEVTGPGALARSPSRARLRTRQA
jgi:hypothetical protein